MSITVVCGANWGDEGKGRFVDFLAQGSDFVVRYQGGNNAGHTVVNEFGTFKLHLIPSGIFNPAVTNVLGPGMVIDLGAFNDEVAGLRARGFSCENLVVSHRATISFPFYGEEDVWEEERLGHRAYGSTRRGIAPAYADRHLKKAIQLGELADEGHFRERLRALVEYKQLVAGGVYGHPGAVDYEKLLDWALGNARKMSHSITDTGALLEEAAAQGRRIVFEAQLGALRDVYHGIYPFTSSSCTLAGFAPVGGGLFGRPPDRVVAVVKAFSTCVGAGPFVTEMPDAEAEQLREIAFEYGAATGRPRRIGHFDAVATRYGLRLQQTTEVALTKLDSLSGRAELLVCTHYEVGGRRLSSFPLNYELERARPVYERLPGWAEDVSGVRRFADLPAAARAYVLRVEELTGWPIRYVSVGPAREALIDRGA
jgi:adenylosuccinate synthase